MPSLDVTCRAGHLSARIADGEAIDPSVHGWHLRGLVMAASTRHDEWQAGNSYERYMGQWSRQIAPLFLDWLDAPCGAEWLDVGCGTGR
jgi:hypothetical protein